MTYHVTATDAQGVIHKTLRTTDPDVADMAVELWERQGFRIIQQVQS